MNMVKVRIPKPYRMWVYSIFGSAWCSGITFFVLKTWFEIEAEFGTESHPFQFTALQIHGLTAFFMMITYGFFLGTHVQHAWKVKPKRTFGIMLVILPAILMITAYLLYYIAEDTAREVVGYIHLAVGFILPFILIAHVLRNRRNKRKKKKPSTTRKKVKSA